LARSWREWRRPKGGLAAKRLTVEHAGESRTLLLVEGAEAAAGAGLEEAADHADPEWHE